MISIMAGFEPLGRWDGFEVWPVDKDDNLLDWSDEAEAEKFGVYIHYNPEYEERDDYGGIDRVAECSTAAEAHALAGLMFILGEYKTI